MHLSLSYHFWSFWLIVSRDKPGSTTESTKLAVGGIYTWPTDLTRNLFNRSKGHCSGCKTALSGMHRYLYRVYYLTPPTSLCSDNTQNPLCIEQYVQPPTNTPSHSVVCILVHRDLRALHMNILLVSGEKDVTQLNSMLKQYMDKRRTRETMANTPKHKWKIDIS